MDDYIQTKNIEIIFIEFYFNVFGKITASVLHAETVAVLIVP